MVKELNKDISRLYLVYQHDRNRHIQELIPNRVYVAQILAFNGSLTDGPSYSSKTIIITTPPGGKLQEGDEESNAVNKATISFFFFLHSFLVTSKKNNLRSSSALKQSRLEYHLFLVVSICFYFRAFSWLKNNISSPLVMYPFVLGIFRLFRIGLGYSKLNSSC